MSPREAKTEDTVKAFKKAVNMTPSALERFLSSDDSKKVGWSGEAPKTSTGGGESVGHKSGRRILELKRTKQADLSDDDLRHMRKVVGYVKRHLAQGPPAEDARHSRWRYSLMNWGHDPMKGKR